MFVQSALLSTTGVLGVHRGVTVSICSGAFKVSVANSRSQEMGNAYSFWRVVVQMRTPSKDCGPLLRGGEFVY